MSKHTELDDRVMQFQMLELPGQPGMMHMGTCHLVQDLHRELKKSQEDRARLADTLRGMLEVFGDVEVDGWSPVYEARTLLAQLDGELE
jgi:hypothetical protein